ncbi:hypothetical protein [Pedobacter rhizosphaerae]|uniref:YD repeat-containing protein n=1 Tax=Pedobacter rhizosphaerae TaxID=390241 RepID=A0A1H9VEY9_9SPHI|nr:hypothetical protein [Pedobacter rhizosphaerae]SES20265.1 YD repeat-containing protein [Pedobacter rhizosphaerae]
MLKYFQQYYPNKRHYSFITSVLVRISLIAFLYCGPLIAFGQQELPDQIPPSPMTMQFQKYGDYPVSQYTGIPDIRVPIYTIQEGDINIPIYLSFHASGLVLDEGLGFVGTGWTLQTGGLMSRTINGIPDDLVGIYPLLIPDFTWDYESRHAELKDTYENRLNDHELDLYSYNALGRSGKFLPSAGYLDSTIASQGNSFMLREDNIRLSTMGFTDENGISCLFGGSGREEYQDCIIPRWPGPTSMVSTWHLASVTSSRYPGMGVSYQYQRGPDQSNRAGWEYRLDDQYMQMYDGDFAVDISNYYPYSLPSSNHRIQTSSFRQYETRVPQKITFSSGYLLFYVDGARQLTKIEIYNKYNQLQRTVELDAVNFPNNYRRKLRAVIFKDALGLEQERYKFNYFAENSGIGGGKDHWGFYNATPDNGDYVIGVPNFAYQFYSLGNFHGGNLYYFGGGATREPNPSAAQTYMLQQITFPTGGFTKFEYEGNIDAASRPVGGLRIKKISSYIAEGEIAHQKMFSYEPGLPEVLTNSELYMEHAVTLLGDNFYEGRRTKLYEDAPVSLSPKGAPIGYPRVTETEGDVITKYYFDNGSAYTYERMNNPYFSVPGESTPLFKLIANNYQPWNFGNLIGKDISSPGYERKESYNYQDSIRKTVHDLVINQHIFPMWYPGTSGASNQNTYENSFIANHSASLFTFANRYHHSAIKRQTSMSVSEKWANGAEIKFTEDYEYGNPQYPLQKTAVIKKDSRGDIVKTNYKYAYDFISDPIYQQLADYNRIAIPIEETNKNVTQNKELNKVNRDFALFNGTSSNPGVAQLSAIRQSHAAAPSVKEITVDRYDNLGHILQQTDKSGLITSFIYGYDQFLPVAKIIGADYNTAIALVNQSLLNNSTTSETDMRNHLSILRNTLSAAQVSTYTYKPGIGMGSSTDPRGQTVTYEYDNYQRLKFIKDHDGNIVKAFDYHIKP